MSSANPSPEATVNPLAPVEQLARWLVGATVHVGLALLIGIIAAWLMRSRHLHWSWATSGLGLVALAKPALGSSTWTLGAAALSATICGRRWHRADLEAGADLAETAADRRGPLDVLCSLAHRAAIHRREVSGTNDWLRGEELLLGREQSGRATSIPFGGVNGGTHTLVVGATGSGKTVTQTWMAVRAIECGMGAIVVDPKGDRSLRSEVRRAAHRGARPFIEWTPDGPSVYNPYARGSETEIADKALAGERFTEPHYLRQAQRHLGHVVRALRKAGVEVSLQGIVHHLDPARLECVVRGLPESEAEAIYAYLDSLTSRQQSDLAGVRDRLAILAESDVGLWLDPQTPGAKRFDLLEAVQARAAVYFNLESDSRPLLTQMLGAAIVQDLQTTVASMQGRPTPTLVVIDEFSAVAAEHVVRLFSRARSAGFSLLLGTQELSDLRLPGRERLLEQIMGNLSVLVAHRQVVPDSAELIASLAGTKGAWRTSRHGDGKLTRTRIRASVLDANEVMSLQQGCAAVIVLAGGRSARIARIFRPKSRR
jgi:TraM recognition site of TraD and TraG/Type IV secretion-system coupling protein DNA-binding domain